GKTVQIIPHVTGEIRARIEKIAVNSKADVMLIELGGTVGDIESMPFLEAVRQLHMEVKDENIVFVHTTLIPEMSVVGEQKTKPTQHSVKELRTIGIQPDIIVGRATRLLDKHTKQKISMFCDVPIEAVISAPDAKTIYEVPLLLEEQGLTEYLVKRLSLPKRESNLEAWRKFVHKITDPQETVWIAIVGKYTNLHDSYLSHIEALNHAGAELGTKVKIAWIEAEDVQSQGPEKMLAQMDGILIPGGFGERGSEGKIASAQFARENNIPFLGICFGFQLAIVEFCRNVLGYKDANSTELNHNTKHPVIDILPEQKAVHNLGGTMRLGAHTIIIKEGTLAHKLYGISEVRERHRHRYEVNPDYIKQIEEAGMLFSGHAPDGVRMEIMEIPSLRFHMGSQFHPEFKSRPLRPSPMFYGFVNAALSYSREKRKESKVESKLEQKI
ncbi:MAG: CTP synthase (glutamine hydrolyzing), partial [Thermoplasmata archaeon]